MNKKCPCSGMNGYSFINMKKNIKIRGASYFSVTKINIMFDIPNFNIYITIFIFIFVRKSQLK